MKKFVLVYLVFAMLLLPGLVNAGAILKQGTWSGNNHKYVVVDYRHKTWDESVADMKATLVDGYYLATITSQEEQDFINSLMESITEDTFYYWLGGYQPKEEKRPKEGWIWVTGETWSYTNWWSPYEPNDYHGVASQQHLAITWPTEPTQVSVLFKLTDKGKWDDGGVNLNGLYGYIAEFGDVTSQLTLEITYPTEEETYTSQASPIEIGGTASNNVVSVTWENAATGEKGACSGTTNWTCQVPLVGGNNVIQAIARDSNGKEVTDQITVMYPKITISGRVKYLDIYKDLKPACYLKIEAFSKDANGTERLIAKGFTKGNEGEEGYFELAADNNKITNGEDVYIKVYSENEAAKVHYNCHLIGSCDYIYDSGKENVKGKVSDNKVNIPIIEIRNTDISNHAEAFGIPEYYWILREWFAKLTKEDFRRSLINIEYPFAGAESEYGPFSDNIFLIESWKGNAAHEYAHAIQKELYNALYLSSSKGHQLFDESNEDIAFNEGWAQFLQEAFNREKMPNPSPIVLLENDLELSKPTLKRPYWMGDDNDDYVHENAINENGKTGEIVEGAVASIFWDIYDNPKNDDDRLSGRFSDLWTVLTMFKRDNNKKKLNSIWNNNEIDNLYHYWIECFGLDKPDIEEKVRARREFDEIFTDHGIPVIDDPYEKKDRNEQELNDVCSYSYDLGEIRFGQEPIDDLIVIDPDWYEFTIATEQQKVKISVKYHESKGKLDVKLYSSCDNGKPKGEIEFEAEVQPDKEGRKVKSHTETLNKSPYYLLVTGTGDDLSTFPKYEGDFSPNYTLTIEPYEELKQNMKIQALCPIDLLITDPNGQKLNKDEVTIPLASYTESDLNGDGDPDDLAIIPNPLNGNYTIKVIPEPDAKPTDTYTLQILYEDKKVAEFKDIAIKDIPQNGYIFDAITNQLSISTVSDENPALSISPEKLSVQKDDTFTVNIEVNKVTDLFGASFELQFNGDILEATGAKPGDALGSDVVFLNVPSKGKISVALSKKEGDEPFSGSGTLATIDFKAKADGKTEIAFDKPKLTLQKADGSPIPDFSELTIATCEITVGQVSQAMISMEPSDVQVKPGDEFTLEAVVSHIDELFGASFEIQYDGNILEYVSFSAGDFMGSDVVFFSIKGDNAINMAISMKAGADPASGNGTLAEIKFKARSAGRSQVSYREDTLALKHPDGTPISVTVSNCSVTVGEGIIKGDVNNDGNVRSNDAILALRIASGLIEPTPEQRQAADMNGDGMVRSNDAILILREAAGLAAPGINALPTASRKVTVTLPESHGVAGERLTIPLKVDNADLLAGGDICITYDDTVLRASGVESNLMLVSNIRESGKVYISFADVQGLREDTLADIQFDILRDSVSSLEFDTVELYQPDALPLASGRLNGRFSSWAIPPERSDLMQNFPNPFNPETWIPYQLRKAGEVTVRIHSLTGELIRELKLGHKSAGLYITKERAVYWDGKSDTGELVSSGVYFYTIQAGSFSSTRKMIIMR